MRKKAALLCQSLPPYGLQMDDVISTLVSLPLFTKTFLTCTKDFLLLTTQLNSIHLSNVSDGKRFCQYRHSYELKMLLTPVCGLLLGGRAPY